ncbi:hypothetical protein ACSDQ9_13025 [Aestuariimicrobium soli]|uniref:hypothetical protein n=1 Tax=Aestuariimicrobium soli TaxID=2035834 RepID=UPI003EC05CEC
MPDLPDVAARPTWFGRIADYLAEMYPPASRLLISAIVFFEIYFVLLLNYDVRNFELGWQEVVGTVTVFGFLLMLRIADDLKDTEVDRRLFPHRAVPSGRVRLSDLRILQVINVVVVVAANVAVMNNLAFFAVLYAYGAAMSLWFFARARIQPNLFLALVTHNPVMMIMNIYVISFGVIKYGLQPFTLTTVLLAWTMYFPSLIWEIARKIRAPQEETAYVTYSSLWGHRKAAWFVLAIIWVDVLTNLTLVFAVSRLAMIPLVLNLAWITWTIIRWLRDPGRFAFGPKVDRYTYGVEGLMVLAVAVNLFLGRF